MADGEEAQQQRPASAVRTQVDIWSTNAVQGRERFSYWRDAVCRAVFGISIEARKSVASGMLAALMMDGVPASLPSATGAPGARLLGSITPGSPANWARCLAWMAAQTPPPTEMSDQE